ncbi:MAG: acyl--CoA ligase [Ectothiorhodospiraceae bacterium]|nr:acyl--CoA ligase [Ectothiorhodospiraceae bacterium]MCH8503702.1 acyl--CoA ligase [Ectothiorhodospiraceae bacterium]
MYRELKQVRAEMTAPGADFEISRVTVRGVPTLAYRNAPDSLRDFWLSTQQYAERDYLVYRDERWTYEQAHAEVRAIAGWLATQGVGPGDRVAIAMRNYPEHMLCYWAITSMGAVVVGMNAWWVGPEMVYGIQDSRPKIIFADQERLDRLMPVRDQVPEPLLVGVRLERTPPGEQVVSYERTVRAYDGAAPAADIHPDDDACIFYTSGTTGKPKGALQTHRGCVNNIWNVLFGAASTARVRIRLGKMTEADLENMPIPAALITTPLFHVTAMNCGAHSCTANGGKIVLMYKWDAAEALRLIEQERVTGMSGVPVMARELMAHPDFPNRDTSSLLALGGGGAQLQPDLVARIEQNVATARPGTGYGMTETCGIITSISGDFFVDRPESAGPGCPTFDVEIRDLDGAALPPGEVGELVVRGAPVIRGYLNRPEDTAETIRDGWLHTGDLARMDEDGFIYIVDRIKDMVLRGGENVYCAEVESAIFKHDAVAECTVFGVPDDRLGEEVGACVVPKAGTSLTAEMLRQHLDGLIARHKVPRYIWVREDPLPRNANGKFMKRQLKEELARDDAA